MNILEAFDLTQSAHRLGQPVDNPRADQRRAIGLSPGICREGIDIRSESPGVLLHWLRISGGDRLGVVTYPVTFTGGGSDPIDMERQLVPAYTLRPRTYGAYRH